MVPGKLDRAFAAFLKKEQGSQTNREFARRIGAKESTMRGWKDQTSSITLNSLDKILKKTGWTFEEIFGDGRPGSKK